MSQIPRIIHRTYKTADIPAEWQKAYDSCRTVNPTFEQYFWTDESGRDFIKTHFAWFLSTYDSYPYAIQRVDALRYFLLWHYGGIYIDLDIVCRLSFDTLLEFSMVLPKTWPYGVSNDFMASIPQHPFIIKVALSLHDYDNDYLSKYITVFFTTGPMFLSNLLARWFRMVQSRQNGQTTHAIAILPSILYETTEYSFFKHCKGSSWHGSDAIVIRFIGQHIGIFGLIVIALGLLALSTWTSQRREYMTFVKRPRYCV